MKLTQEQIKDIERLTRLRFRKTSAFSTAFVGKKNTVGEYDSLIVTDTFSIMYSLDSDGGELSSLDIPFKWIKGFVKILEKQ